MPRQLNDNERAFLTEIVQRTSLVIVLQEVAPGLLGVASEATYQMGQCAKMFRDDSGFMQALADLGDASQWGKL